MGLNLNKLSTNIFDRHKTKNNSNLLDKDYLAVAVATGRNQSGSSVKYNYFMLSPELEEILKEEVKKTSVVLVELLDGKNKVLDSKKVKIENLYWAYGYNTHGPSSKE